MVVPLGLGGVRCSKCKGMFEVVGDKFLMSSIDTRYVTSRHRVFAGRKKIDEEARFALSSSMSINLAAPMSLGCCHSTVNSRRSFFAIHAETSIPGWCLFSARCHIETETATECSHKNSDAQWRNQVVLGSGKGD